MRLRSRSRWAAGLATLVVAGCGGPTFHRVEGTVKIDGQPIEDAAILFEPVAGGPAAHGITGAGGRFSLKTVNTRGVLAGDYRVAIIKQVISGVRADESLEPGGMRVTWLVPERYGSPATSGLTITVPGESYDLETTSKRSAGS